MSGSAICVDLGVVGSPDGAVLGAGSNTHKPNSRWGLSILGVVLGACPSIFGRQNPTGRLSRPLTGPDPCLGSPSPNLLVPALNIGACAAVVMPWSRSKSWNPSSPNIFGIQLYPAWAVFLWAVVKEGLTQDGSFLLARVSKDGRGDSSKVGIMSPPPTFPRPKRKSREMEKQCCIVYIV